MLVVSRNSRQSLPGGDGGFERIPTVPVREINGRGDDLPLPEPRWPGAPGEPDEVLIPDARAGLTPADMVDRKFLELLGGAPVGRSHVRIG